MIVRIDQLKEASITQIREAHFHGECWLLLRKNDKEAIVEKQPISKLPELVRDETRPVEVLRLWTERAG